MTAAEACLKLVEEIPVSLARSVMLQLRGGCEPVVSNPSYQCRIDDFLREWDNNRSELAPMLDVALAARLAAPATHLVWTGPATSAIPRRATEQVLFELVQGAEKRLTVMSFGIFQVPRLISAIEGSLSRGVQVRIVVGDRESPRSLQGNHHLQQLGTIVATSASLLQWPTSRRPRDERGGTGLMHAKAAVADSREAFLSSANLTESALERNMELGILVRGGHLPAAIERLVDSLVDSGELQKV